MMTKNDIAAHIAKSQLVSKSMAINLVNDLFDYVKSQLKAGEKMSIHGFGNFEVVPRAARKGRNPSTGAEIDIPASNAIKFTAAKALKEVVQD